MALGSTFAGPGDDTLKKMRGHLAGEPHAAKAPPSKSPTDSTVGRGGGKSRATPKPNKAAEAEPPGELLDMTGEEPQSGSENKDTPIAVLKKIGWVKSETLFNSDAEVFAEFEIPPSEKDRTLVDFQLYIDMDGEYIISERAQGHVDATGRATAIFPIRKGDKLESTFGLKAKHCSGEFPDNPSADRVVTDSAPISFEHTQVSGVHFPKDKSFIGDEYLQAFCDLKKSYLDWKKTHSKAQIIVYGHSEADKDGDPHKISRSRANSAFLFIIGDVDGWADLAEKEKWGVWEQQCMLRALGFFKVKPTGTKGPKTRTAIQDFIENLNKVRGKHINPMLGLSEAYIRKELYREYINLKRNEIELPSSAFRLVSGFPYVGCSAFNRYMAGENLHDENQRAVFVIVQESPNFPLAFPCRSGSVGVCEDECKKPGKRAMDGFRCKFYDDMVKVEKVGTAASSGNGHELETHWKDGSGKPYPFQNDFNDDIYAAAKKYKHDPLILKSLIAQESAFRAKIYNNFGYAGLTQVGGLAIKEANLDIGTTAKVGKKYVFDMEGDERFDPKKSIEAGAQILSIKRTRIDQMVFSKFKSQPSDEEKQKFYLAAYNAGEGIIKNAWIEYGRKDCTWQDLCDGKISSALHNVIPEEWDPDAKYREISKYPVEIMERRNS